jgi:hypothetical protein
LQSVGADGAGPVFSEARAFPSLPNVPRFRGVRRALFFKSRKLISWTDGPCELYDLAADPGETHNLYKANDPGMRLLQDQLLDWASTAPRQFDLPGKLDKSSVERLKSLGYAQ